MSLLLVTSLWWVGGRLSVVAPSSGVSSGVTAAAEDLADLGAEAHYASAIASLEALTAMDRTSLDPEMVTVLDGGMTVIDTAIDQSRAALATQPDSTVAQESLYRALRTKVTLLQDTLGLVNEMRHGNQGTAPPLSEMN
jgi:hypothetical protein